MHVYVLHAFTDQGKGGNPAGLVLDADHLTNPQMQEIAAKIGLSETAFVMKSSQADFKLLFFTPNKQIGDCGHATVATFSYLKQIGKINSDQSSKETIVGIRDIFIDGDRIAMQQSAPVFTEIEPARFNAIRDSLALNDTDFADHPCIVRTEENFLIIPLKSESAVRKAKPDFDAIQSISEDYQLIGYYLFSMETRISGRDAGTRMFAPRYGIPEEAATGMAAGPLGCYLYERMHLNKSTFSIEQGALMNPASPSLLEVELEFSHSKIKQVLVGGRAELIREFSI
ncbi:MAG: PhzF family phenazine biosynthesis protein [Calditrichaeota bacterium]|nr:PhzF family phenazine biosynthesis protein [Calditrichota bacterium]